MPNGVDSSIGCLLKISEETKTVTISCICNKYVFDYPVSPEKFVITPFVIRLTPCAGEMNRILRCETFSVKMPGYWPRSCFACLWTETEHA